MNKDDRAKLIGTMHKALDALEQDATTLQSKADFVDLAAALNGVKVRCEKIAKADNARLWQWANGKPMEFEGLHFRAKLLLIPMPYLDGKALKEARPKIHAEYMDTRKDQRTTYTAR